jgi:hypothetical protein
VSHDDPLPVDPEPDASDVVEGPIGSAWLRDPAEPGKRGADLDELKPIDGDGDGDEASDEGRSIDGLPERPAFGLVGAD